MIYAALHGVVRRACTAGVAAATLMVSGLILVDVAGLAPGITPSVGVGNYLGPDLSGGALGRLWIVAWALGGVAVGLVLMTSALRRAKPRARAHRLVDHDDGGGASFRVSLSDRAARGIVARAARSVEGVRRCDVTLDQHRGRWRVAARLTVTPSSDVRMVTDAARAEIVEQLARATGLSVAALNLVAAFDTPNGKLA